MHVGPPDKASPLFSDSPANTAKLLILVGCAVVLMSLDQRFGLLAEVRTAGQAVLTPITQAAYWPVKFARYVARQTASRQALQAENERLREQLLEASAQVQRSEVLAMENKRLRALLGSSKHIEQPTLVAEITGLDLDPFRHRIMLNKGEANDVRVGQTLIDAAGVMGQVVETAPLVSYAMLISDPDHALPVRINRTGLLGIAYGTGSTDTLNLPDLPSTADVREGDLVVTSGLGGRFPPDYPVARVTGVAPAPDGSYLQAELRPTAALDRSQHVLLVSESVQVAADDGKKAKERP